MTVITRDLVRETPDAAELVRMWPHARITAPIGRGAQPARIAAKISRMPSVSHSSSTNGTPCAEPSR